MASSYNQWLQQGYTPNQAALAAQLGAQGVSRSIFDPPPTSANPTQQRTLDQQAPSAPSPVATPQGQPGAVPSPSPQAAPSPTGSPFQSQNMSVAGYLQDAIRSQLPAVQAIGDEAGRKSFIENYIRTLVPEIQRRGGQVGDIRNEKIQIDGQWRDLIRDISGSADTAQYIVPDEGGPASGGMGMPMVMGGSMGGFGGYGLNDMLTGDPLSRINAALGKTTDTSRVNLDALIAQLNGGQ